MNPHHVNLLLLQENHFPYKKKTGPSTPFKLRVLAM